MIIDYTGVVQLWEKKYKEGGKNRDTIERKIKNIPHIELRDGKLTFNENKTLTVIRISKAYVYNNREKTSEYRRLVKIETIGNGEIPKDITELLEREEFVQLV